MWVHRLPDIALMLAGFWGAVPIPYSPRIVFTVSVSSSSLLRIIRLRVRAYSGVAVFTKPPVEWVASVE